MSEIFYNKILVGIKCKIMFMLTFLRCLLQHCVIAYWLATIRFHRINVEISSTKTYYPVIILLKTVQYELSLYIKTYSYISISVHYI